MPVTPKMSFRAGAETVAAIADVRALLAAKRGKPVSQAGAIDYAVRRAAEDLRAEPERRLSPDDVQMVREQAAKAGWPEGSVIETWKDDSGSAVVVRRQLGSGKSQELRLLRVPVYSAVTPESGPPAQRRRAG
jgi:hypothetical protein